MWLIWLKCQKRAQDTCIQSLRKVRTSTLILRDHSQFETSTSTSISTLKRSLLVCRENVMEQFWPPEGEPTNQMSLRLHHQKGLEAILSTNLLALTIILPQKSRKTWALFALHWEAFLPRVRRTVLWAFMPPVKYLCNIPSNSPLSWLRILRISFRQLCKIQKGIFASW